MSTSEKVSVPTSLRIKPELKALIEQAAKKKGLSMASWIKMTCKEQAESDLKIK